MRAIEIPNQPVKSGSSLFLDIGHLALWGAMAAMVLMLTACPPPAEVDGGSPQEDAGDTVEDGGEILDAGEAEDAGAEPAVEPDGLPDGGPDVVPDAGAQDGGSDSGTPDPADAGPLGDGGSPADAGPDTGCTSVSDCDLGSLCIDQECVPGCEDDRDCVAPLLCAADVGANGTCQECLVASDCGDGQVCASGSCRDGCSEAAPSCPGEQICDIPNQICVRCLEDANCELGNICEAQACIEGCRSARDCPSGEVCLDDICQVGCTAAPDDSCPLGTHCGPLATCEVGCNGDDGQCGASQLCEVDTCVDVCISSDECGDNEICFENSCTPGCSEDVACDSGVCDAEAGEIGLCQDCLVDADCTVLFVTGVCDPDRLVCRSECTQQGNCFGGNVCDVSNNLCVGCLQDTDCNADSECNLDRLECELRDLPAAPYCGPCDGDDDCTDGLCVNLPAGNFGGTERVCGLNCGADGECPQGTTCQFLEEEGVIVAEQCVPTTSAQATTSCTAFLNTVEAADCSFTNACGPQGAPFNGVCVLEGGAGTCTLACNADADCPDAFACTGAPVIGVPIGTTGVCEPVAP